MNAVERILEYVNKEEKEASWSSPSPPQNWPKDSSIQANNVRYKYRPDLPEVIQGI